jgi:hypothetical protein
MLLLGGLAVTPEDAAASCTRSKAAAYYAYDYGSDSYILQSVYDDGVDIGNSAPIDENGQPYEMLDGVWDFYPPPGWDGSYPPTHLFGNESGAKQEASGPTLSSGGNCTKLPPVVVRGQRQSSSGILRMHIVVRAPRNPAPGMDGVWFGPKEPTNYAGNDSPQFFCAGPEAGHEQCRNACAGVVMQAGRGDTCSFSINGGQGTMKCKRNDHSPQSSMPWDQVECQ